MYSIAFYALRCYLPEPNSGSICFKHHMSKNWFSNSFMYGFMVNNFKPSWYTKLVGGFNPSEKSSSNWKSSASFRVKINIFWNHHLLNSAYWHFFQAKKKHNFPNKNIHNEISSENHHPLWHCCGTTFQFFPSGDFQRSDHGGQRSRGFFSNSLNIQSRKRHSDMHIYHIWKREKRYPKREFSHKMHLKKWMVGSWKMKLDFFGPIFKGEVLISGV